MTVAHRFEVRGTVQGVGFRPFIYRLASAHGLAGFVGNDSSRVFIEVTGPIEAIDAFADEIISDSPPLAAIERIERSTCEPARWSGFRIVDSRASASHPTLVPPDVSTCPACLRDLFDADNRRFRHPFVTCTDCGPRFTIIAAMPYDRPTTTMAGFEMCAACRREYEDPTDRRYHAQPIACHECGPTLTFVDPAASELTKDPLGASVASLLAGKTVAIKGLGGYHLACDALSDEAVALLRTRKRRPDKPFAVMVRDLTHAREFAHINAVEAELLTSPAAPIVLLTGRDDSAMSALVAPTNPLIGIMVASTPLHHLLFAGHERALVMTSANRVGEPLAYTDPAISALSDLYDAVLDHDRDVLVPCDDSVVRVVDGQPMPIRRARGYAPIPVKLDAISTSVVAAGGELKNTFCLAEHGYVWVSQHIGDMENLETMQSFEKTVRCYKSMYNVDPAVVAVDRHPGYLSSGWGRNQGLPIEEVQHHHAHIGSIMAEHQLPPTERVIGFAFDGTGYGDDGTIWGGEVLVADAYGYERTAHLAQFPLPGGDAAVRNPCRVSLGLLHHAGVPWDARIPSVVAAATEINLLQKQFATGFGVSQTSSMGRLFDAVASLVGLRHTVSFEAQAAIDLEFAAAAYAGSPTGRYRFTFDRSEIGWESVVTDIATDVLAGIDSMLIASEFHDAVAEIVERAAERCRAQTGISTIALSGGVFQNALLVTSCRKRLQTKNFTVLTHEVVPPNDGGLALGQAYIAVHRTTAIDPLPTDPAKEI